MERTNEEALDLFADLIEPAVEIISDKRIEMMYKSGNKIAAIKQAIKCHKSAVIEILSLIDGIPKEEYKVSVIALPIKLMNLINNPELEELFTGQSQKETAYSGSATENIEEGAN